MMITKELIKKEIDSIENEYLEVLYKIIRAIQIPSFKEQTDTPQDDREEWRAFIRETYGCLADDPIERGEQGGYEIREEFIRGLKLEDWEKKDFLSAGT
jgi:hypothetical protein